MPVTKEEVIQELKLFHEKKHRSPITTDYNPKGDKPFSTVTITRLFGTWNNALKAAGLDINNERNKYGSTYQDVSCATCKKNFRKLSKDIVRTNANYCSRRCNAIHTNKTIKHYNRSKMEAYLCKEIRELYPDLEIKDNYRALFKNCCEIDIYIPELKLAIEVNGICHYKPIYGQERFDHIKENDKYKEIHCTEQGVNLLVLDISRVTKFSQKEAQPFLEQIKTVINKSV